MTRRTTLLAAIGLSLGAATMSACERAGPPSAAVEARLSGNVLYRERMALPAGATIEVRLEDVSLADAPADVIVEQTIASNGRQVPIPFELRYAPDRIEPGHRYGLRASIRSAEGQLTFTTTEHHAVLERGAPTDDLTIVVQRTGGAGTPSPAPAAATPGGLWRLAAIQRPGAAEEAVGPDPPYTIELGADGRVAGQAHCNRFSGGYRQTEPGRLEMLPMAATLAACPEPSIASEIMRAIGSVTAYELRGDRLRLSYNTSGVLVFARDVEPAAAAAPEVGRTFVFDCAGDVSFTVRNGPGEVALWAPKSLGGRYSVLGQVRAASGARYEEGDTVYWNQGDSALFEVGGQRFADCKSNPRKVPWADAARLGVKFRALGNEPSWSLEITADRLAVITDLGTRRTELPYATPVVAGATTTYRATGGGHTILAIVERKPCTDNMSGEGFEATATVTLDGPTLRGCGRSLN